MESVVVRLREYRDRVLVTGRYEVNGRRFSGRRFLSKEEAEKLEEFLSGLAEKIEYGDAVEYYAVGKNSTAILNKLVEMMVI